MKSIRMKLIIPLMLVTLVSFALLIGVVTSQSTKIMKENFLTAAKINVDGIYSLVDSIYTGIEVEREIKMEETRKRLLNLVETAVSILEFYHQEELNGRMSRARAQSAAKEAINGLRYGNGGYFWMDDKNYTLLVLPPNPSAVGMDREELKDVNGKQMVKELVDGAVRDGSTFVEYWFPKLSNGDPFPKLGCAIHFEPWGWIVGTGEYIDSIDEQMEEIKTADLKRLNTLLYNDSYFESYGFVKDRNGAYIAYVNQDKVGQVSDSKDVRTGESLNDLYFSIGDGPVEYYFTKDGEGEYKKFGHVRYYAPEDLTIVYTFYEEVANREIFRIRNIMLLMGLIFILLIGLLFYIMIHRVTTPITHTADMLKDISQGEGDLTKRIELKRVSKDKDEVERLAFYFNTFIDDLEGMIIDLKNISKANRNMGDKLASNTTEISASSTEMAATTRSINDQVNNLSSKIDSSTDNVKQIKDQISQVNANIDSESTFINESSAAITEMVASIQNLTRISSEKQGVINELAEHSRTSGEAMEETARDIIEISNSVDTILELVNVINDVSERINLLSMNAAIEAAHAGDAGKGFAVVADEIRKLAETTNEQSGRISQSVQAIAEKINKSGRSSKNSEKSIGLINSNIQQISDTINELVQGMTEISEGSKQIIESLEELVSSSQAVRESAVRVNENSDSVLKEMDEINQISQLNLSGIQEVVAGNNQISSAINDLAEMGNSNNENINSMDSKLQHFQSDR